MSYKVYLADVSYFSGKLEAYLRYTGIPYQRIDATPAELLNEVYVNTGYMKVPTVKTDDDLWLRDTTPMIQWFEAQHGDSDVIPSQPALRFLALLIEDYADEWLWRPALYWRWKYKPTRRLMGRRIADEVLKSWPGPARLKAWYFANRQWRLFVSGDGVDKHNEDHVRAEYLRQLEALESILEHQDFILGNHPTAADFGYFGPFFRHFFLDPAPSKVMLTNAPRTSAWVMRMWTTVRERDINQPATFTDFTAEGWKHLLKDMLGTYLPYLQQNAEAYAAGKKTLDFNDGPITYRKLKTIRYRVHCLQQLKREFATLTDHDIAQLQVILQQHDLDPTLLDTLKKEQIDAGLDAEQEQPLQPLKIKLSFFEKWRVFLFGTPWDMLKARRQNTTADNPKQS